MEDKINLTELKQAAEKMEIRCLLDVYLKLSENYNEASSTPMYMKIEEEEEDEGEGMKYQIQE